jgi:hypothetical protein
VWNRSSWADLDVFADVTPAVRFGAELAHFEQTYADGKHAPDERAQLSAFFLF